MTHDTDKCPKCGGELFWCENCNPRFGYCQSPDCAYETAATSSKTDPEVMLPAALHRIRELEARIETLELTVKVLESDKQTRNDALDHERARIAAKDKALVKFAETFAEYAQIHANKIPSATQLLTYEDKSHLVILTATLATRLTVMV